VQAPGSAVRQNYSWFLDSRSETDTRHLTNAGWSEWTAAMCGQDAVDDLYARLLRFCRCEKLALFLLFFGSPFSTTSLSNTMIYIIYQDRLGTNATENSLLNTNIVSFVDEMNAL
jgi:hypothetical protein